MLRFSALVPRPRSGGSAFLLPATRVVLWVLAIVAGVTFVHLAARRLFHPLELDCIEGVMMDHVVRLAAGKPIYVEPSLEFIPLAYMPGFAWASSLLARVFGPALWEPRLIALAASLGLAALIARVIQRETASLTLAAGGAGVFFMGFALAGSSYDIGRPDPLMLVLAFAGLAALRWMPGIPGGVAAAALLTLAFFTKQHAVLFAFAGLAYLVQNDRRRLPAFALSLAVGCGGGYLLLANTLGPWFSFYTWDVPSSWSELSPVRLGHYLGSTVFGHLGVLASAVFLSLVLARKPWSGASSVWWWAGLAAVGTGAMATLDPFAYQHMTMGTIAGLSLLAPIAMHRLARSAGAAFVPRESNDHSVEGRPSTSPPPLNAAMAMMFVLLSVQFLPLLYSASHRLPHADASEAHAAFVNELSLQHGGVLVPYHGFFAVQAGKRSSLHVLALDDLLRGRGNRLKRRDPEFFERLFEPLRRGPDRPLIVTDVPLDRSGALWASLATSYQLVGELGWLSEPLRPMTGNAFTPTYVYAPLEPNRPPPARFSVEWVAAHHARASARS